MTESIVLHLRTAVDDDGDRVYQWANDPDTRAASFHPEPIPYPDHVRWFRAQLESAERNGFIAEVDGASCAVVRLDRDATDPALAIISINVAPSFRGRGLGTRIIEAASSRAGDLGFRRVHAYVRPENAGSKAAFTRAGYVLLREAEIAGAPALLYEVTAA